MSLKAFHIIFILASSLLFFGFGVWLLIASSGLPNVMSALAGVLSFAIGGALIFYGIKFLKKFKRISFM